MIDPNQTKIPLPKQLGLNSPFRPQGYYTTFRQWPIYPQSSNQYWSPNQVIKIYNTIDSGVMDPYRSSIQFVVSTTQQTQPVGQLQVDKLATSFFSQLVLSSKNVQIQRLGQYDSFSAMVSDIGCSQVITQGRTFQGMGYSNIPTNTNVIASTSTAGQVTVSNGWAQSGPINQGYWWTQNGSQSTIMPTRTGTWGPKGSSSIMQGKWGGLYNTQYWLSGLTNSNVSSLNYLWANTGNLNGRQGQPALQQIQQTQGRFNNIRAEYNLSMMSPNYPDSNSSNIQLAPYIQNQTWTTANMLNNSTTSGFNPKAPYVPVISNNVGAWTATNINNDPTWHQVPNTAPLFGYTKPICAQTCKSANQATISATVPTCQMNQGMITPNKFAVSQRKFIVPLMSAIVGALIPPDQFLLIQMKALKDLLLQLTLSPYAMFTSGFSDVHQFDQVGMATQQKRVWQISQFCWNIHLYTFGQSSINAQLNASLVKGIAITSTFYFLGNTFQLPNGQVIRNMWPISCQSQSCSEIYVIFLSNQFLKYSGARKQFRLSNNITSMQIRLKTQFYPSQPIVGNAGNPEYYQGQSDNAPFLKQLYLSNNYIFNLNTPMPKINKINFAINGRCYNVNNTNTFYDPKMLLNTNYTWTQNSVNLDTAMGMSALHQNRYVGMAIYSWTWDPYGHSTQYMNGINTSGNQNFGIQFTNSAINPFPTDQTMIIFCRTNGIVLYTQAGVQVIGK